MDVGDRCGGTDAGGCGGYLQDVAAGTPAVLVAGVGLLFWVCAVPAFVTSRVACGGCGGCGSDAKYSKRTAMQFRGALVVCVVAGVTMAGLVGAANKSFTEDVQGLANVADRWAARTLRGVTEANEALRMRGVGAPADFARCVPSLPGDGWAAPPLAAVAYDLRERLPDLAQAALDADHGSSSTRGGATMLAVIFMALVLGATFCASMTPAPGVHYAGAALLACLGVAAVGLCATYGLAGAVLEDVCAAYPNVTAFVGNAYERHDGGCADAGGVGYLTAFPGEWKARAAEYVCNATCGGAAPPAPACDAFVAAHPACGWESMGALPALAPAAVTEGVAAVIRAAPPRIRAFTDVAGPVGNCAAVSGLMGAVEPGVCGVGALARRVGGIAAALVVVLAAAFVLVVVGSKRFAAHGYHGGYGRVMTPAERVEKARRRRGDVLAKRLASTCSWATESAPASTAGKPRRTVSFADDLDLHASAAAAHTEGSSLLSSAAGTALSGGEGGSKASPSGSGGLYGTSSDAAPAPRHLAFTDDDPPVCVGIALAVSNSNSSDAAPPAVPESP
eukprot:TRINITY_DN8248_c0_g4_i1.p1 TRINITY_DN8248_c0_g4~~TRINITY_DN8248_c0_g4_i1.p1  ORF type:complete len:603 (+),score=159.40 TRINITY_DN8248_c0_g4_i1:122-1810(+)